MLEGTAMKFSRLVEDRQDPPAASTLSLGGSPKIRNAFYHELLTVSWNGKSDNARDLRKSSSFVSHVSFNGYQISTIFSQKVLWELAVY